MTDTTHEAPDLLPCPFCGGVAKYYHRPDTTGWSNTDWVSCESDCCGVTTCMHETKEEAIASWNTRADLVQQDDDDFHPATAGDDPIYLGDVEYITRQRSDDLVQAAVAAKLREAADELNYYSEADYIAMGYPEDGVIAALGTARACQQAILALITPDAQAALDRVRAEGWARAYREGWRFAHGLWSRFGSVPDPGNTPAAIREGGE